MRIALTLLRVCVCVCCMCGFASVAFSPGLTPFLPNSSSHALHTQTQPPSASSANVQQRAASGAAGVTNSSGAPPSSKAFPHPPSAAPNTQPQQSPQPSQSHQQSLKVGLGFETHSFSLKLQSSLLEHGTRI